MATAQKPPQLDPNQNTASDNTKTTQVAGVSVGKEFEGVPLTFDDEAKIFAEIQSTSEALDRQALEKVRAEIPEAKRAFEEANLPKDVRQAGVVSPQIAAEKVVSKGAELDLPISSEEYDQGSKAKVEGKTVDKSIIGVSSLIALTMWAHRLILMAHKHAMRVVFKKNVGGQNAGR